MKKILTEFIHERQLGFMDCGPTCLKMIANYYQLQLPESNSLETSYPVSENGISYYDLAEAVELLSLRTTRAKISYTFLNRYIPLPCIAHVDGNHYVVIYGISYKTIYISDPASGPMILDHKTFKERWYLRNKRKGAVLIIHRN